MKKLLLYLLLLLAPIKAADVVGTYTFYQEVALTSAAQTVTIQQIASGTRDLQFKYATVWCSVNTTFTISRTGTAATATTGTVVNYNPWQPSATAIPYTASNVGTGTLIKKIDFLSTTPEVTIPLTEYLIKRNAGTTGNITINTTSVTGTCRIGFTWSEIK